MVAAKALLVSNTSQQSAADSLGLNRSRIAHASTVLTHAPDLAEQVIGGGLGLDAAYAHRARAVRRHPTVQLGQSTAGHARRT